MSCNITAFPTVATVIGLSPEALAASGSFVATIAVDPDAIMSNHPVDHHRATDIKTGDPVTQAVVDNVLGKLPNKTEQVPLRCEVCNVTVHGQHILEAHLAGTKHAKKLKAMELMKGLDHGGFVSNTVQSNPHKSIGFMCSICQVSVNSSLQLQAHLEGSKHKTKVGASDANTTYLPTSTGHSGIGITGRVGAVYAPVHPGCDITLLPKNSSETTFNITYGYLKPKGAGSTGQIRVDVGANRLYCAACNVTVNSDIQLHQHITSRKHSDKVNGRVKQPWQQRSGPYSRHSPQYDAPQSWNRYPPVSHAHIENNFVSGGMLH